MSIPLTLNLRSIVPSNFSVTTMYYKKDDKSAFFFLSIVEYQYVPSNLSGFLSTSPINRVSRPHTRLFFVNSLAKFEQFFYFINYLLMFKFQTSLLPHSSYSTPRHVLEAAMGEQHTECSDFTLVHFFLTTL